MQNNTALEGSLASYPIHPFYILEQNSVASFFEPLVSVQKMGVIGLETVSRAVHPENQSLIEPRDIFRGMPLEESGLKLALDRLFRQKGLEEFSPFQTQMPSLLLFLDVEPSVLEETTVGSGHLLKQVRDLSLDPQQVVVQISLASEMNPLFVKKFIDIQRSHHFLIALTDLENQPDHLDTLLRFNPDMVRVADSLVRGLASSEEKRDVFRRIINLAHSLGVLVIAGGIESEEDALVALELGTDLLQGGYFSRDYKDNTVFTLGRKARMQFLGSRYRRRLTGRAKQDRELMRRCGHVGDSIFARFTGKPPMEMESASLFRNYPSLECLYWLNGEGVQAGEPIRSQFHIPERKRVLFQPSLPGSNHSLREYYYALSEEPGPHVTEPYLSMNSGNLCVTVSHALEDPRTGDPRILCVDLNLSKI